MNTFVEIVGKKWKNGNSSIKIYSHFLICTTSLIKLNPHSENQECLYIKDVMVYQYIVIKII